MAVAALLALAAAAAARADERADYAACLDQAARAPSAAFERALAWQDEGGGFAARHCAAVALVTLGEYAEAADRLEKLAEAMQAAGRPGAAEVLGQAGNAWLLGRFANRAEAVFSAALELDPDNPELLVDHARAYAELERDAEAAADLDRVLAMVPEHAEALIFRASTRRRLGQLRAARTDLALALSLEPDNPEALLESGLLHLAAGDEAAARQDLVRVRLVAPESTAAEVAGARLQELELGGE